jgi:hypothetical protein
VRLSGPAASIDQLSGNTPARETRPHVGRTPTTPHHAAGLRTEPPVSSPSVNAHSAAAVAIPEPDDEPPGSCSTFHGLHGWPKGNSRVPPRANSVRLSLPKSTAPAARRRATTVASAAAGAAFGTREPIVVGRPLTSNWSFTAKGTPCSGPHGWPAIRAASACRAAASASSRITAMYARSRPSRRSIRSR